MASDDECCFEASLFVNEDYEVVTYEIGGVAQRVRCSMAASTDHDLTGQVVWPVSVLLGWFVARERERFRGARVLEVGAGCGVAGLIAAAVGADATLTDGSDTVCRLLARAGDLGVPGGGAISSAKLVWGDRPSLEALGGRPYDFVLGADVVQWPALVAPLLQTVRAALAGAARADAAFFVGVCTRAAATEAAFLAEAERVGFSVEERRGFLPDPPPANAASKLPVRVLELRVRPGGGDVAFQSDDPNFRFDEQPNAC